MVYKFRNCTESKGSFAKSESISVNTLNKWIKEIETENEASPKFIKVTIPERCNRKSSITIRFGEFEIIVDENTSKELLSMALCGVKTIC